MSVPSFSLAQLKNGNIYSIITDHLGTPQEMVDSFGQTVWRLRSKAYGEKIHEKAEEISCPFRFQGQYFDDESGLHYNRFRYYDPELGRFVSQDPIGLAGGVNSYRYAHNSVGWVDPWGLACTHKASNAGKAYAAIKEKWGRTPSAQDMRELNAAFGRARMNDRTKYPTHDGKPFDNDPEKSPKSQRLNTSGSYQEWTVKTPGVGNRGERRIVIDRPNQTAYYSDDHYDSYIDISGWVFS